MSSGRESGVKGASERHPPYWCHREEATGRYGRFEDDERVGWILDVATVSAVLDRLVDDGVRARRVVDIGSGERSYYRTRAE